VTSRRDVRVSASFFEDLDRQLGSERGPNGEPSTVDFQTIELLDIVDFVAKHFDELPPLFEGRDDYRVLVKAGILIRAIEVLAVLAGDGAVELLSLELDLRLDWD